MRLNHEADVIHRGQQRDTLGVKLHACRLDVTDRLSAGERNLEHRETAGISFQLQRLDHLSERQVLMRARVLRRLVHPCEQFSERRVTRQIAADRQRIGQETDQRRELRPGPVSALSADDYVVLPGIPRQQRLQRRQQGHRQRRPGAAAQLPQIVKQAAGGRRHFHRAVVAREHRPLPVSGELRGLEPGKRPPPVVFEPGQQGTLQAVPLPHGIVSELHRQLRQARKLAARLTPRLSLVQLGQLLQQHAERPVIQRCPVGHDHQCMLIGCQPRQARAQRPVDRQVERAQCLLGRELAQLACCGLRVKLGVIRAVQAHLRRRVDHLNRAAVAGREQPRPQHLMPGHQAIYRAAQRRHVQRPAQPDQIRNIVCREAIVELIDEPQLLLRERQGQFCLTGGSARDQRSCRHLRHVIPLLHFNHLFYPFSGCPIRCPTAGQGASA